MKKRNDDCLEEIRHAHPLVPRAISAHPCTSVHLCQRAL